MRFQLKDRLHIRLFSHADKLILVGWPPEVVAAETGCGTNSKGKNSNEIKVFVGKTVTRLL